MLDLEDLKAKLAEYDPTAPKCQLRITHHQRDSDGYGDYDMTTHAPCCRPEGHEDECRNARQVIGWPGFQTVSQLVAEVERLRSINDGYLLEMGRQHALLRDQAREAKTERAAVVAWLRSEAEAENPFYARSNLDYTATMIERGEHRKENP